MTTEHRRALVRIYSANWRKKNPEKRKKVMRNYYIKNREKILKKEKEEYRIKKNIINERNKAYTKSPEGKEAKRIWRSKNLKRMNAYRKVYRYIQSGKLIKRPCIICGKIKVHAHHEDYNKPLKVIWLCRYHHYKLHHP